MPQSSKQKSHKQSKHSAKESRDCSDSDEDMKMKEKSSKEESSATSVEKRKASGKDLISYGNGESKEMKGESLKIDAEKGLKEKEMKNLADSKSKSSKRQESSREKKEENVVASLVEKEDSKSGRVAKRKSEKDSARKEGKDSREVKEKEVGLSEKEKKSQNSLKRQSGDSVDEKQGKRGKENAESSTQNELYNPEVEKESERRSRKRREGSGDRDKYVDVLNESDSRRLSSRWDRSKDERQRDGKHKDGYGDKYQHGGKDDKDRDAMYLEDVDKDRKQHDEKSREYSDRDGRHREGKYQEDGEIDNRHMHEKYLNDGDRDSRRKNDKHQEDGERERRDRDDKYREDSDKDDRHRDDKYREDGDKDGCHNEDIYHEDVERDDRQRNSKYREASERDSRRRDDKQADENDKDKRLRYAKYKDERAPRDRLGDRSGAKHPRDESYAADLQPRKSSKHEGSPGYDDLTRFKDDRGRRRTGAKEDIGDFRSRSIKELRSDAEKRSMSSATVDLVTESGRSISRNSEIELVPSNNRRWTSPSSGSHATRDYYRFSKQDGSKHKDYPYEERVRHGVTRDYGGSAGAVEKNSSSRKTEKLMQREDNILGESSAERRFKSDLRSSPLQQVDKSPSSASYDRRHSSRSEVWRTLEAEESTQRSGSSRDVKEGRGSRDLAGKALAEDDGRGKSNNHHRRINDPNIGRMQGHGWKRVPNWPLPVANGFMPFQHGPPPVGFHPMIPQFPTPSVFGVRPSMDLSHPGITYHIPDADHFPGHVPPMGWRTPVDGSCGPPMHGWNANNAVSGEEAHLNGRPDWDQPRTLSNSGMSWETSDAWKGPLTGSSVELPSGSLKEDYSVQEEESAQPVQSEQKQTDADDQSNDISQSRGSLGESTSENVKTTPEEQPIEVKPSEKDDSLLCHVYLSKLDISAELTEPELFDQCISLIDVDKKMTSYVDDSRILFLEGYVVASITTPSKFSSGPPFAVMTDSVFQKALSLYQERREVKVMNCKKWSFPGQEGEAYPGNKFENFSSECGETTEPAMAGNMLEEDGDLVVVGSSKSSCPETSEPMTDDGEEKSESPLSTAERVGMEGETVLGVAEEGNPLPAEEVEGSSESPTEMSKDLIRSNDSVGNFSDDFKKEKEIVDVKCDPLLLPYVSSEAFEAVMPESIEFGSVNLSRIHHSPESTH
ncbi:uncharacterized protein LOC107794685 isoform X3 [Nicotiana tabacum]|uniref:Uncharacterized protein LOC107794685 isoform X3 n=1 Tax=Nicotiana tabacum TaxID=4097 RepID=A0A1S4A7X3_TOBAC|nr:zinc finger CCCH domain-containing protein 13-like isoform X3 [Nicotiana tomentosiformis]XP_016472684.1 PREDICTED: zinc finger CCCH domain-containing protein 13-like isoform X3 [Nicotiana tabacum]